MIKYNMQHLTKINEWFPNGISLNLSKVKLIFLARELRSNAVWPHAAFISDQSTGADGNLPRRKLFIVPK